MASLVLGALVLASAVAAASRASSSGSQDRLLGMRFTGTASLRAVDKGPEERLSRSRLIIRSWRFVFRFKLSSLGPGKQDITAVTSSVSGSQT
jgi:hypothetical protein